MIGIYLSGTGNTEHCITKLVKLLDETADAVPLESASVIEKIKNSGTIVLGYPTQFSNAPYMVRDFIKSNPALWNGKKVLCVATMGLFSGDGAGCTARMLKKYGTVILGGLHIKMPDSVCDSKKLKKSAEENREIIKKADKKIEAAVQQIISMADGKAVAGNKCTMCYRCISRCPQKAITLVGNKVEEQCRYEKYCR